MVDEERRDRFDSKFCGGRKPHHRIDQQSEDQTELDSLHNRMTTAIVVRIQIGDDDPLNNNCNHPERDDGSLARYSAKLLIKIMKQ